MTDTQENHPSIYADFALLEQRTVAFMSSSTGRTASSSPEAEAFAAALGTGRRVATTLVALGDAFGRSSAEFAKLRESLRELEEREIVTMRLLLHNGAAVQGRARAPAGILTRQEIDNALSRAAVAESDVKTIAVEYHAPAAPGRRKVGGAQWKTERRGGFSRR